MQLDQERTRHEEEGESGQEEVSNPVLAEMEEMEYFGKVRCVYECNPLYGDKCDKYFPSLITAHRYFISRDESAG